MKARCRSAWPAGEIALVVRRRRLYACRHAEATIQRRRSALSIVVAAGRGERAGAADGPKQYRKIGGRAGARPHHRALLRAPADRPDRVAIHADDRRRCSTPPSASRDLLHGGDRRRDAAGIDAAGARRAGAPTRPRSVLIQDAVRPFVEPALIDRVIAACGSRMGALPALPVADTLKRADGDGLGRGDGAAGRAVRRADAAGLPLPADPGRA